MKKPPGTIRIEENFLPREHFESLCGVLTSTNFPWYFTPTVTTYDDDTDSRLFNPHPGFFYHEIYKHNVPCSPFYDEPALGYIHQQLNFTVLIGIRANLNPRLPEPYHSEFHFDLSSDMTATEASDWTTSIFYVNTNNGYTEMQATGERVESVANRLVSFPASTVHRAVTQTDEQTRILINFNYM